MEAVDIVEPDFYAKDISCITQVTQGEPYSTGNGVIVAVLDSGIDFYLDEFLNEQGKTRIIALWDQSAVPSPDKGFNPPEGFMEGVIYTREQIDAAIAAGRGEGYTIVPQRDASGHGTAVAGVAAGSISGVATKADLLIVKLGTPLADSFPIRFG